MITHADACFAKKVRWVKWVRRVLEVEVGDGCQWKMTVAEERGGSRVFMGQGVRSQPSESSSNSLRWASANSVNQR